MKLHSPLKPATLISTLLLTSLLSSVASAEQAAHEHGAANLTIATTEKGLEIALETPAANVFGFEYTPSSESDHHTIHEAVEVLEKGDALFLASAEAGCKLADVDIESAQVDAHDKEKHEDHDEHKGHDDHGHEKHAEKDEHKDHDHHGHDKHEEKDDHKGHDDHGHEKHAEKDDHKEHDHHDHDKHAEKDDHKDHDHDDHKGEGETHNDVDVTWQFTCKNVSAIKQVEVKLFSAFPKGFEDLDIDWVSADKAGHAELGKDGVVSLK